MRRAFPLLVAAWVVAVLGVIIFWQKGQKYQLPAEMTGTSPAEVSQAQATAAPAAPVKSVAAAAVPNAQDAGTQADFRQWMKDYALAPVAQRAALLPRGETLAQKRKARMARLIRESPQQALAEAVRLHEYAALPADVRQHVERPFSQRAAYDYFPVCGGPAGAGSHLAYLTLPEGKHDAFTYGRRAGVMSKHSLPVQGIALDGAAAFHDMALQRLDAAELTTARSLYPAAQQDATRSWLTGQPIAGAAVVALGGGRLFYLASESELTQVNQTMAKVDQLPGPKASSDVLYQAAPAPGASVSGFDLPAAQAAAEYQASQWTETAKNVFIIRVDFSDNTGAPYTQAETATAMNGVISDQIRAMSYGKTWIIAGASANVYRLPQTAAYYVNGTSGSSLNSELIRDARNTFRNTRSGGDASIDTGPVSNTGNGDSNGLGSYDIVGILFGGIGMRGSSFVYGGLAGGGNLWLQDSISPALCVHEFGHNYGIGHSGLWVTSDGSVTGTGSNDEYGDDYDIMGGGSVPEGYFHPQAKVELDWLAPAEWADATALGTATHRVYRIDSQFTTGTPRGVRITRSAAPGSEEYFWLGYRPLYTGLPYLTRGAYMVWQRPGESRSWLVDTTPNTAGGIADAPIRLGRTFSDAASNAFITPLAVGGSGDNSYLDVRVNFGPYPGNAAPTAGSITGPSTVPARTNQSFSITASDSNGDALAYAWDTGSSSIPDNAASITQNWTVAGSYTLSVTVSDMKGGTVTVTKNVTVTDPLNTWTAGSVGSSEYLEQLVYGKGRFLAGEYFGGLFLSWDGVSWENLGEAPNMDQPKLAFGSNVFVAAGTKESANTTAQICWSADGRRWTTASFPNGVPLVRAVSYGDGKFLAVGDGGTVLSSTDGKTWSLTTVPSAPDLRRITWSGSSWVAMAMHATNARPEVAWTSTNGSSWTQRSALGFDVYHLHSHAGRVYALGWYGGITTSTDHGVTWTEASVPSGTRWTSYYMATATDGTMLCTARAMDESGTVYALLISADGQHWARATGNTDVVNAEALTYAAGRFHTVESAGITRRSDSFFPGNAAPVPSFTTAPATGTARQAIYLAASATDANGDALTYSWDFGSQVNIEDGFETAPTFSFGGSYSLTLRVSDDKGGTASLPHTLTITDPARSFTNRSVANNIGDFQAVAASGSRVVAVGSIFSGSYSGLRAWSADGITWNTGNLGSNRHLYGLVHDGSQFVGAGTRYDFTAPAGYRGWVATSADGETWTERYFTGKWLNDIAYGASKYVAVGDEGNVVFSSNGTSWSAVTIPGITTSVSFKGVAWNGTVFVITGHTGGSGTTRVFTSSDGQNWMDQTAGAGVDSWQDLRKTAWLNDRFISSGWYSRVRSSTDNGVNFTTSRTDYEYTPAMAYGAGIWFAAGINRSAADADIDLLSLDGSTWFSAAAPTTTDRSAAVFYNNNFITVGAAGSIWQSATLSGASGFPSWQSTYFPSGGLTSLADRDPDLDGMGNLVEYALNYLPTTSNGSPSDVFHSSGRAWLRLQVPEPARSDVRYIIQGTDSLNSGSWVELARKVGTGAWTWQTAGTSRISQGAVSGGRVPTDFGVPDAHASGQRYFMRLVVEQQ